MRQQALFFLIYIFGQHLFFISTASLQATELGSLAKSMQAGTWAVLKTEGLSREFLETYGGNAVNHSILQYANKAQWDPNSEQFLFLGSPHDNPFKFIIYDAASNTWRNGPLPNSCMQKGHYHGGCWVHSYYYSALDPNNGKFYFYFLHGIAEYDIAANTWQQLPGAIDLDLALYGGLSYFPNTKRFIFVAGQYGIYEYQISNKQWRHVSDFPMGDYHNISIYNAVHDNVLFGGGNNNSNVYRMNGNGVVTSLGHAPQDLVVCSSIVTVDPASGNFLVCFDDGAFYELNAIKNVWSQLPSPPPEIYQSIACNTGLIAAPVSNHGVTMFLTYNTATVYLYKHKAVSDGIHQSYQPTFESSDSTFQMENFPNPFNSNTNVEFHLAAPDTVELSIFTLNGQHVETLYTGQMAAGNHQIDWDANGYPSGVYICRLITHDQTTTLKMLYIK